MDNNIIIGTKVDKESMESLKSAIEATFRVGFETHMDQKTIQDALEVIGKAAEVKNVSITNSRFSGDKVVNIDQTDDSDEE